MPMTHSLGGRASAIVLLATAIVLTSALSGCTSPASTSKSPTPSAGADAARPVPSMTPTPISVSVSSPTPGFFVPVNATAYATIVGESGVDFDSPSGNLMCGIFDRSSGNTASVLEWGCRVATHTWTASSASPSDYCYTITEIYCGSGVDAEDHEIPHPLANSGQLFAGEWPKGVVKALPYGKSIAYKT
ncbi:MAG: hypothetical protein QOJ77_559, partial [Microbacteriaceae bacterium]|nr:hypothetical protein [Microbacteriaceae bacterium]